MPHKGWKRLLLCVGAVLAIAGLTSCASAPDSSEKGRLRPHQTPVLHSFLDSADVFPESVAVDQSSGAFFVGSVKEGTIYKGRVGTPEMEVFSPGGADGRSIATGMSFADDRLVVAGRQTGLVFVYDTTDGSLISKLDNGRRTGQTFLNDAAFAPDGSAYVTDSINPVLYRVAPTASGRYELQEFLRFADTPVTYVNAPGAAGININGIVATENGRFLIIGKRNENALFRVDLTTREIIPVRMPAGTLDTPDGLFLDGSALYVAQNLPQTIAILELSADFSQAELKGAIGHPTFAFPTSVARHRDKLLVVSAQFDTAGSPAAVSGTQLPVVPFWVTELEFGSESPTTLP